MRTMTGLPLSFRYNDFMVATHANNNANVTTYVHPPYDEGKENLLQYEIYRHMHPTHQQHAKISFFHLKTNSK